jgi:hypothetical protein
VSFVLTPADLPTSTGGEAIVSLIVLNAGTEPATINLPGTLIGSVGRDGQLSQMTFSRRDDGPRAVAVPPGGFARAAYAFNVPSTLVGNLVVQLDAPLRARTVVLFQAPSSPGGDAAGSATASSASPIINNRPVTAADQNNRSGFVEYFADHFSGHEPVYILVGSERPNAKFQVSFKYRVLNPEGSWTQAFSPLRGVHLAYCQTSFWDLEGES